MLNAEHRRTIQLFKRMIDQFDRLKRRNAFLEQSKKEKIFENGLEEFDDARYVFFFPWLNAPTYLETGMK